MKNHRHREGGHKMGTNRLSKTFPLGHEALPPGAKPCFNESPFQIEPRSSQ